MSHRLQGYAALDQLRFASNKRDRALWLDMAMGPLFRAASALGADMSAQPSISTSSMRSLLHWLRKDATAAPFEDDKPEVIKAYILV